MSHYSSPLLELPLHLLCMVLAQLDSMQSLGSAIISHSLFYNAFNDDTKRVVRSILRNQIPPELICYAEATFKAQVVDNNDGKEVSKLLRSAFESCDYELDGLPFQHWRLEWIFDHPLPGPEASKASRRRQDNQPYGSMGAISIASTISRTYGHVEYFCECFFRERLPLMQKLMGRRPNPQDSRPSQMELFRIRRALYRFQLYCNLNFRDVVDFHPGRWIREMRNYRLGRRFFNPFSPWVNEQLACVHDYQEEVLSRTFDDTAAHEVVWGAMSVDWLAQGRRNEYKQAFVGARHHMNYKRRLMANCSLHTACLSSLSSILGMNTRSAVDF